jgi:hypothetical protein
MQVLKFQQTGTLALYLLILMAIFPAAKAQSTAAGDEVWQSGLMATQPAQLLAVSPQLTDFEAYGLHADQPLVAFTFSAVSADLGPHIALSMTPLALAPLGAPEAVRALGVEFSLSQSLPAARNAAALPSHSVAALLDFDELAAFESLFNSLAASGMPQSPFSNAKPLLRMVSKGGMRLEFTPQPQGRILCIVTTKMDSVTISMDPGAAEEWTKAFSAARQTLNSARHSAT